METIHNYDPVDDTPTDEVLCYQKCLYTALGYLEEDGTVSTEFILKSLKKARVPQDKFDPMAECFKTLTKIVEDKDVELISKCFRAYAN